MFAVTVSNILKYLQSTSLVPENKVGIVSRSVQAERGRVDRVRLSLGRWAKGPLSQEGGLLVDLKKPVRKNRGPF